MTFYATPATGAAWIVPKRYVERVGDDGFKKRSGRRRPVSARVVHARASSWCSRPTRATGGRRPTVKRLVFRVGARRDHAPGHAQARRGGHRLLDPRPARRGAEADARAHAQAHVADLHRVADASPSSGTRSRPGRISACGWPRASAIDRKAINDAEYLGYAQAERQHHSRTPSQFYWPAPPFGLRSRRGPRRSWPRPAIRAASTPVEVATDAVYAARRPRPSSTTSRPWASARGSGRWSARAFYKARLGEELQAPRPRAAARRPATPPPASRRFVISGGIRSYGGYPDIDALFQRAGGRDGRQEARGAPASASSSSCTSA